MRKDYKTILNSASAEIEEKKSRFIASLKPVACEEEAVEFVNMLKSRYWDAAHNVYAYHIGGDQTVQRFSDDGEPSGTAGVPVLEVIKRTGLQDVVIVVTRYFGGTLLGAAGLIRAYGRSAAAGIDAAQVVGRQLCIEASVVIEYTLLGKVQSLLASNGYPIKDTVYEQDVEIILYVPVDDADSFAALITEATNARALVQMGEKTYITVDGKGKIIRAT